MSRPGVVDLRDLARRYAWQPRDIEAFVAAAGLTVDRDPAARRHAFAPPRVLVAIGAYADPACVARSRPWLADAEHVVVVRDHRATLDDGDEAELEPAWRDALGDLRAAVLDWTDDASTRAALARALALASSHDPRPAPVAADPLELRPGPWIELRCDRPIWWLHAHLASQLAVHNGRAVLVADAAGGRAIDLAAPPLAVELVPDDAGALRRDAHVVPDAQPRHTHPGSTAHGTDPIHPVAWRGDRMTVYWSYVGARASCFLSANDHDWPCGPAKKLWGYKDNDPVQVCVAPDASAYAARFGHDVLVSSAVPIGWQRAGDCEVATFERDRLRAVFYARDPSGRSPHDAVEPLEEDARDLAPPVVLGPDAAARYAIGLAHAAVRIERRADDAAAVELGGPDAGIAVFDAEHRLVRRGSGRLLGGWFRWATVEDDGAYWREDLATGERVFVAPADLAICLDPADEAVARDAILDGRCDLAAHVHASRPSRPAPSDVTGLAIPGTRNVLVVADRHARVI